MPTVAPKTPRETSVGPAGPPEQVLILSSTPVNFQNDCNLQFGGVLRTSHSLRPHQRRKQSGLVSPY